MEERDRHGGGVVMLRFCDGKVNLGRACEHGDAVVWAGRGAFRVPSATTPWYPSSSSTVQIAKLIILNYTSLSTSDQDGFQSLP